MVAAQKVLELICVAVSMAGPVAAAGLLGARPDSGNGLSGDFEHSNELVHRPSHCKPFHMSFSGSSTNYPDFEKSFAPLDAPDSYELSANGLSLFLDKPSEKVVTKDHVNSKVAEGSTFNSTFTVLYGRVTYNFSGPAVPGVVAAAILIGVFGLHAAFPSLIPSVPSANQRRDRHRAHWWPSYTMADQHLRAGPF